MKTIQFTGTQNEIENLHLASGISDNDMPRQTETRVYVIDVNFLKDDVDAREFTDEEFMTEAELQGTVYTLAGFQIAVNYGELFIDESYVRFLTVHLL